MSGTRTAGQLPATEKRKNTGRTVLSVLAKTFITLILIIAMIFIFLYGTVARIINGPSPKARDLFVRTVTETSSGGFLAGWFLSDEEIEVICNGDGFEPEQKPLPTEPTTPSEKPTEQPSDLVLAEDGIEIYEVKGGTYKGKMMIVSDPARIALATSYPFTPGGKGLKLKEMVKDTGAVAGINGAGFVDTEGNRGGGQPVGLVIKDGELIAGSKEPNDKGKIPQYEVSGFTAEGKLIVGKMTAQEALDAGIVNAVSFAPTLIKDGVARNLYGRGSGLNPRTAIGQRADGAVLLLVIDGRQPQSLGATYADLVEIMVDFGAVNAGNLDGGSSSLMVYKGEIISKCCSLYGPRRIPTGFVVLAREEE